MYWRKDKRITFNFNILLNNDKINFSIKEISSSMDSSYCNYVHTSGKYKGTICGTISKVKNGKCYKHDRRNIERPKNKKLKKNIQIVNNFSDKYLLFLKSLYKRRNFIEYNINANSSNIYNSSTIFSIKYIIFVNKSLFDLIIKTLYPILDILNVQNYGQIEKDVIKKIKNKKKKKRNIKKVIILNNNVDLHTINEKIGKTFNIFEKKNNGDDLYATLIILQKENIKLFKLYINIILSNLNMFFKNVNMDIFFNIWKNIISYKKYEKVLIFSDCKSNEELISNVFLYVRCNYKLIPETNKILWIRNESVLPYFKKYNIDFTEYGIKIYYLKDINKNNPLPLDKLIILYY